MTDVGPERGLQSAYETINPLVAPQRPVMIPPTPTVVSTKGSASAWKHSLRSIIDPFSPCEGSVFSGPKTLLKTPGM
ncbi:hypothetical protein ZHAS_00006615 [Anopheles sinensis]|uniref:Uncharacterized protein n=1 Tax=Anopheles sinensis TaxID=74873 RepID=A0A084VMS1_ANOSI|nr:hypothetical protein ZHAS_00006615 [Anopheles sinensis]